MSSVAKQNHTTAMPRRRHQCDIQWAENNLFSIGHKFERLADCRSGVFHQPIPNKVVSLSFRNPQRLLAVFEIENVAALLRRWERSDGMASRRPVKAEGIDFCRPGRVKTPDTLPRESGAAVCAKQLITELRVNTVGRDHQIISSLAAVRESNVNAVLTIDKILYSQTAIDNGAGALGSTLQDARQFRAANPAAGRGGVG
ncbi:hypothetical protein D3C76_690910 [compost metagenome]